MRMSVPRTMVVVRTIPEALLGAEDSPPTGAAEREEVDARELPVRGEGPRPEVSTEGSGGSPLAVREVPAAAINGLSGGRGALKVPPNAGGGA